MLSCEFYEISYTFSYKTPPVAASVFICVSIIVVNSLAFSMVDEKVALNKIWY